MSRGGIIIKNRSDGRGMMLPEREGHGTFNKLPFVSMTCPKEEIGINPISNNVIIKTRKISQKIKKDKIKEKEDKLLENYRKLKTTEQFWKKNENPIYKDYNKKIGQQLTNNIKRDIQNENKITYKEMNSNVNEDINNKMKTQLKLNPIINSSTLTTKKKLVDEKKNDDDNNYEIKPEIKEVKVVKEIDTINQIKELKQNNDIDNKVESEDKENEMEENKKKDIEDKKDVPLLDGDLDENENIDDVINYLNGLDYDKYCKDMEIREALTLLKNKMDKEKEEKDKEEEKNNNKIMIEGVEQKGDEEEQIKDNNEDNKDNKLILPEINKKIPEQKSIEIVNEEELKRKEEIKKYKLAEQISKTDQMKAVHSVNSIKKLLQREGLDKLEEVAPLKITVIKENPLAKCDGYEANKLPFLHSLPLV